MDIGPDTRKVTNPARTAARKQVATAQCELIAAERALPQLLAGHGTPKQKNATVDQSDMDALKPLLDDSGWKVTLGIPLKKLLAPEQIKSSLRDPSPAVTLDNVTTLIGGQYYVKLKEISAAINAAVPGVHLKMTGPSANAAPTNIKLDEFVTAMEAGLDGELLVVAVELGVARVRRRVQRESGGRPARLARTARHRAARHAEPGDERRGQHCPAEAAGCSSVSPRAGWTDRRAGHLCCLAHL